MARGSAGGIARAKMQKAEARERKIRYNKAPNYCLKCGKPIYANENERLCDVKKKKFCNNSCAASYNNIGINRNGEYESNRGKIFSYSDGEILKFFESSSSCSEFLKRIGYSHRMSKIPESVVQKLKSLNLEITELKNRRVNISELTKEELFRDKAWQSARGMIAKDARKRYENSNKPKKCLICGYDIHFDVAHIKAVSSFDNESKVKDINDIENLIALCPNHHWEYDNSDLTIEKLLKQNGK